mmetsp:Transcript_44387/g.110439  ORF Transcript_44387/g.110439 Transcript_44387/m.110439 type:complete len:249 (+) Transcript_44387:194-940(+)
MVRLKPEQVDEQRACVDDGVLVPGDAYARTNCGRGRELPLLVLCCWPLGDAPAAVDSDLQADTAARSNGDVSRELHVAYGARVITKVRERRCLPLARKSRGGESQEKLHSAVCSHRELGSDSLVRRRHRSLNPLAYHADMVSIRVFEDCSAVQVELGCGGHECVALPHLTLRLHLQPAGCPFDRGNLVPCRREEVVVARLRESHSFLPEDLPAISARDRLWRPLDGPASCPPPGRPQGIYERRVRICQ